MALPWISPETNLFLSESAILGFAILETFVAIKDLKQGQWRHSAAYLGGTTAYAVGLTLPAVAAAALATHSFTHLGEMRNAACAAAAKLYNGLRATILKRQSLN